MHSPEITLVGARFSSTEFPEAQGYVFEVFRVREGELPYGLSLPAGTWVGSIQIVQGWNAIESGLIQSFILIENTQSPQADASKSQGANVRYEKFVKVNRPHELSSFNVDVRGGSTDGAGKNEHGLPHFHLLKKNSNAELGKVNIPELNIWNNTTNKIELIQVVGGEISRTEKKELVEWLSKDNNANLLKVMKEWNARNKDNLFRAILTPLQTPENEM